MHSKRCLAAAIIAAVENLRDVEGQEDHGFRMAMEDNMALAEADSYLNDGTMPCSCGEYTVEQLFASFERHSHDPEMLDHVQVSASQALADRTISPEQYVALARRCRNLVGAHRIRSQS